jgi:hypothetical protein
MSIEVLDQTRQGEQAGTHAACYTHLSDRELTSNGWLLVELELVVDKAKNKTRLSNSSLA